LDGPFRVFLYHSEDLLSGIAPGVDEVRTEFLKALDVVGLSWLTQLQEQKTIYKQMTGKPSAQLDLPNYYLCANLCSPTTPLPINLTTKTAGRVFEGN